MSPSDNRKSIYIYLFFLVFSVFVNELSNLFGSVVDNALGEHGTIAVKVFLFFLFAVATFFFFTKLSNSAGEIVNAKVKTTRAETGKQRPYMIMGYSPLDEKKLDATFKWMMAELEALGPELVTRSVPDYEAAGKAFRTEYARTNNIDERSLGSNPWQQNLRSLWFHRAAIREVLILDPEKDQFDYVRAYVIKAFSAGGTPLEIERISAADRPGKPFYTVEESTGLEMQPRYENYAHVYEGLNRGLEILRERHQDSDVERLTCVDATAGLKIFSIAAAILTLNRHVIFSYVTPRAETKMPTSNGSTADEQTTLLEGGEIRFYDISLTFKGWGA